MKSYVEFKNVKKSYDMGEVVIKAVDDVSFSIDKGEFVVILGASGAGKSTILNLLGGMDYVSEGSIYVDGNEVSKYDKKQLTRYRRDDIGFVFQFYNLVQNLNAVENVELAVEICKDSMEPVEVLKSVGLEHRLYNFPSQLSGGEQQRVSIARAIAKNPKLLLCDEPTGALDYNTGKSILKLLASTAKEYNMTVIVITHNSAIAPIADRVITVKSGKIASVQKNENPVSIESIEW
ncbi:putative ABC transport system ATP-binding protein [Clostridium punense]|uniref:ABC transport system ATP-binding protein n=1 Tax=Clostridium punense TaxID=1054297 RepID=A0ABS4JYG0_9CLOT|nr:MULTISPECIES: ABC transporter ATP-binding protein [Clostridium]EQB88471.1 macrolide ABC transporter ATP-binding protein [Clostridium sp. BL8]MBP2020575.1 putative ABC transport system ATP-binding protein [Clostridium punense]